MKAFSVQDDLIPESILSLFEEMTELMWNLPELSGGASISCHTVCAFLSQRFPVVHTTGFFADVAAHSWLESEKGPRVIMDMYPVGGASSLIVSGHIHSPWHSLYKEYALKKR